MFRYTVRSGTLLDASMTSTDSEKSHNNALLMAVFIGAATTSMLLGVLPGNHLGVDDWAYIYTAAESGFGYYPRGYRPLNMLPFSLAFYTVGIHPVTLYILSLCWRALCALLAYLIARVYIRDQHFLLLFALMYVVFLNDSFFLMMPFSQTSENLGSLLFSLLALYLFVLLLKTNDRWLWLAAPAVAIVALLIREDVAAWLVVLPVAAFLLERRFDRISWAKLLVFEASVGLSLLWYALPVLGISETTYGSQLLIDFSVQRLINLTIRQFLFFFNREFLLLAWTDLSNTQFLMTLSILLLTAFLWLAAPRTSEQPDENRRKLFLMLLVGLGISLLGIVLYLPAVVAEQDWDTTLTLAKVGFALLVISGLWLITSSLPHRSIRLTVRYGIVLLIALGAVSRINAYQQDFIRWQADWSALTIFMRSLTHEVPAVTDDTLFIYVVDPERDDQPFVSGWSFELAVRYAYDDAALGYLPPEPISWGTAEVTDEGILMQRQPGAVGLAATRDAVYGWDEVIVITLSEDDRAIVLFELPEELHSDSRANQYAPLERIERGYISPNAQRLFYPLTDIQNE